LRIQLVIMGADAAKAREADTKIRRSALAFLGAALAPAQAIAKISPCGTVALYRGAATASVAAVLDAAIEARRGEGLTADEAGERTGERPGGTGVSPVPSSPATPNEPKAPAAHPVIASHHSATAASEALQPESVQREQTQRVRPEGRVGSDVGLAEGTRETPVPPVASPATAPALFPAVPPVVARGFQSSLVASAPAPAVASVVSSQAGPDEPRTPQASLDAIALLSASDVPGLRALAVQCPYAPGVRFGLDASGGLHAAVLTDVPASEASAMASLHTVQTWAREHASLLALALHAPIANQTAGLAAGSGYGPCTLHLLTTTSTALRSLMHAPVRVHLVVQAGAACVATRVV
jgi:hypothetical protein